MLHRNRTPLPLLLLLTLPVFCAEQGGATMIQTFLGNKYLFELEIVPHGKRFDFQLYAIDRKTFHYSNINDLNTILSWLNIESEDPLIEDKCWTISKSKMEKFRGIMRELLTDKHSLRDLEYRLAEDRGEGEWANQLQIEG